MEVYNRSLFSLNLLFVIGIKEESEDRAVDTGRRLNNIGHVPLVGLGIVVNQLFAARFGMLGEVKIAPVGDTLQL